MHLEMTEAPEGLNDCHPKTRVRAEISRTPLLRWSTPLQIPCTTRFETQYEAELASGATVSVRSLTDTDGTTAISYTYTPYGETTTTVTDNDAKANHSTFTARDYETSFMMFYRSRFYGNRMGRFFSKDSVDGKFEDPLSLNKFLYVEANPCNYVDPLGLRAFKIKNSAICIESGGCCLYYDAQCTGYISNIQNQAYGGWGYCWHCEPQNKCNKFLQQIF